MSFVDYNFKLSFYAKTFVLVNRTARPPQQTLCRKPENVSGYWNMQYLVKGLAVFRNANCSSTVFSHHLFFSFREKSRTIYTRSKKSKFDLFHVQSPDEIKLHCVVWLFIDYVSLVHFHVRIVSGLFNISVPSKHLFFVTISFTHLV